jgi:hypothetical protein
MPRNVSSDLADQLDVWYARVFRGSPPDEDSSLNGDGQHEKASETVDHFLGMLPASFMMTLQQSQTAVYNKSSIDKSIRDPIENQNEQRVLNMLLQRANAIEIQI